MTEQSGAAEEGAHSNPGPPLPANPGVIYLIFSEPPLPYLAGEINMTHFLEL